MSSAVDLPATCKEAKESGHAYYFTGKPCANGNVDRRSVKYSRCECVDCRKSRSDRVNTWRKAHPDIAREMGQAWRDNNRKHVRDYCRRYVARRGNNERDRRLKSTYGIDLADYMAMLGAQNNACALCGLLAEDAPREMLMVDHCHKTGVVRGLLCDHCNKSLGIIEKYRDRLPDMLAYVDGAVETVQSERDEVIDRYEAVRKSMAERGQ